MAATKTTRTPVEKDEVEIGEDQHETHDTGSDNAPAKIKRKPDLVEIDEPEALSPFDEKSHDEDSTGASDEDDEFSDNDLDGEELNPFGDRWEE